MLNCPEEIIAFTVPYLVPPSGNHYKQPAIYRTRDGYQRRGFRVGPEAKAFYEAVAIFARGRTVAPITDKERKTVQYAVRVDVYLGPRARGDFDNFWKCALDSLVHCGVIHNDSRVDGESSRCVVHKDDRDNPRTEFLVERMVNHAA